MRGRNKWQTWGDPGERGARLEPLVLQTLRVRKAKTILEARREKWKKKKSSAFLEVGGKLDYVVEWKGLLIFFVPLYLFSGKKKKDFE